jgi:hypothetical protein
MLRQVALARLGRESESWKCGIIVILLQVITKEDKKANTQSDDRGGRGLDSL